MSQRPKNKKDKFSKVQTVVPRQPNPDYHTEKDTSTVAKYVNKYKITKGVRTIRVDIKPDPYGHDLSRSFKFSPTNAYSEEVATKEAYAYRDEKVILNVKTNTGYADIKVSKGPDGTVKVMLSFEFEHKPYQKAIVLSQENSYTEALKTLIHMKCDICGFARPMVIYYDNGLATAYHLGYKGTKEEYPEAALRYRLGEKIICPKTGDEGKVVRIVNDINYLGEFDMGERYRVITDHKLAANTIIEQLKVVSVLEADLKNEDLTPRETGDLADAVDKIKTDIREVYVRATNNSDMPEHDKQLRVELNKYRTIAKLKYVSRPTLG